MFQFTETDMPLIISLLSEQMAKAMMGDSSSIGMGMDGLLGRLLAGEQSSEDIKLLDRVIREKIAETAGMDMEQDTKMLYASLLEKLQNQLGQSE